jgi:hypothetical protein
MSGDAQKMCINALPGFQALSGSVDAESRPRNAGRIVCSHH